VLLEPAVGVSGPPHVDRRLGLVRVGVPHDDHYGARLAGDRVIRPARAEEAETIQALVRAAYAMYVPRIGREPSPMTDDYAELIAGAKVWVIDDAGGPAGVVVLEDTPVALQVENVAVRPESQGQGLGRALLSFADDEARRRGYRAVILYTNVHMTENLIRYPALGYVEVGRGKEHGFDRVFFRKELRGGESALSGEQ
jgi:GNAT superfamily N-acetyltransferase